MKACEDSSTVEERAKTKNGSTVLFLAFAFSVVMNRVWSVSSDFWKLQLTVLYAIMKEFGRYDVISFD